MLLIIVAIATVSQVSATDDVISQDEILSVDDTQVLSANYAPKDYTELKDCIANANDGDTIELNGTYSFDQVITVDKSINIVGVGDGAIIKKEDFNINTFNYFYINQASNVTLSNLKFIDGDGHYGGALYWTGDNGNIINCEFSSSIATKGSGGAVAMYGKNCSIENCIFYNNKAENEGGALYWAGNNGNIINCEFRDNWAEGSGIAGAVFFAGDNCLVENCTFTRNYAVNYGGAIVSYSKGNKISNSSFSENYVTSNGTGQGGGAIYSNSLGFTVDNCTFNSNNANSYGGAIYLNDYNTVKDSYFNANFATLGNDIYASESSVLMSNYILLDYNETFKEAVFGIDESIFKNMNDVEINKIDSVVTFIPGMAFEYGGKGTITVMVEGGEIHEENVTVLNHTEAKISYKNNLLTVSGLNVGEYILRVTTTPDDVHNSVDKDLTITVKKALAVIKVSKITVAWKKGTLWSVKIVDSNNNRPIANMQVTLKVYTGKKYKTVNIKTNSKGIATYQTKGLSVGTHKVVLSATHSQYKFSTVKSSITVVKQTPLSFKVTSRTEKDGSILTIKVSNKATKKPINGVKVKLLIYTGKKYKTIVLKTISSGKSVGVCGYSTNKLSVGTHKVVIKPVAVKYSGSAASKMTIKSSAKNYPAWQNKLSGKV